MIRSAALPSLFQIYKVITQRQYCVANKNNSLHEHDKHWGNFRFEIAGESDVAEMKSHVRNHFVRGEPICSYLGWSEELAKDFEFVTEAIVTHGLSFTIRHKNTGELVGVNLVMDSRLPEMDSIFSEESGRRMSVPFQKLWTFLSDLENLASQTLRQYPFHAEIFVTSVARESRGHGLATQTYVQMIPFLKNRGFPLVKGEFTSPFSRAAARKVGFTEAARHYYKDQTENGVKVFPTAGENFATEDVLVI